MFLTKPDIEKLISDGKLIIEPLFEDTVVEDGVDLRVGTSYAKIAKKNDVVDLSEISDEDVEQYFQVVNVSLNGCVTIAPNEFVLISTLEYIKLPNNIIGICNLRSTFARWGLMLATSLIVSPGFTGNLVLEIVNFSNNFIKLRPGLKIISLKLFEVKSPVNYSGKYKGQKGIQLPKSLRNEYLKFRKFVSNDFGKF